MFCTWALVRQCEDVKYGTSVFSFLFFLPLLSISSFVLWATYEINGIFQNKIKVAPYECGIIALGNKEICEKKKHHLDSIVARKHLFCLVPLPPDLNSQETPIQPEWMNEMRKYRLLCDFVWSWNLICCKKTSDVYMRHKIRGSNSLQMINPSPTAISLCGAAWLIYILSIYIQMKMACLPCRRT